ncbi:heavy metal-responsive transcriptional regulator [Xanthomonas massiliensis]|uniref:heavy metal-responsive transcriptional regulator n=1 Tax=Xanthomonas massiliensis TaxID=1720302 RepID=UPI00098FB1E1|nr:heavy metal-responsive transcriptional regulator [Xanthomonas massiliensis]
MDPKTARSFTIGTLARATGVSPDTLRWYERQGLLPAPRRRPSGYREYDGDAVGRVRFVRGAKELGFSLEDIAGLLRLQADPEHGVDGIRRQAQARLAELDARIARMTAMRDALAALVAACPGEGDPQACPILGRIHAEGAPVPVCGHPGPSDRTTPKPSGKAKR